MMTFLIEAFVLCVLFHLEVLLQVRREPAKRVYGYPPTIDRTRGRSFCLVLPLFPANTLNHSFTDSGKP